MGGEISKNYITGSSGISFVLVSLLIDIPRLRNSYGLGNYQLEKAESQNREVSSKVLQLFVINI